MKKISSIFERKDSRGIFREYFNSDTAWKSLNGGNMSKGAVIGNHYHKKNRALFFLVSGSAQVYTKARNPRAKVQHTVLRPYEGVVFEPYEAHAIRFLKPSAFLLAKTYRFNKREQDLYPAPLI